MTAEAHFAQYRCAVSLRLGTSHRPEVSFDASREESRDLASLAKRSMDPLRVLWSSGFK